MTNKVAGLTTMGDHINQPNPRQEGRLDANQQGALSPLSPVAAASVPLSLLQLTTLALEWHKNAGWQ